MIHVVAIITTLPGKRATVLAMTQDNLAAVRAEDGCIAYQPVVDASQPGGRAGTLGEDSFMVIEEWESMAALQAHAASPHMAAYGAATKPMVASRTIHVLSPAG